MSRAKKIVTHWTAHSCLAAGLGFYRDGDPVDSETVLRALNDHRLLRYGGTIFGCCSRRRKPLPETDRYSTSIANVTCPWCVERFDELVADWAVPRDPVFSGMRRASGEPLGTPVDAIAAAHKLCCSGRGATLLADAKALEASRRARLSRLVFLPTNVGTVRAGGLEDFVEKLAKIDPAIVEALRPAIDECTMALDLIDEAQRFLDRAQLYVDDVKRRIADGEVLTVGSPDGAPRPPKESELLCKQFIDANNRECDETMAA